MTLESPSKPSQISTVGIDNAVLASLLQAIAELTAAPHLDDGLDRLADCLQEYLKFDSFGVLLLGDLGHELRFRYARGYRPEVLEHWRFGLGQGLVGTVARTGRPERVGDVIADPRYIRAIADLRSELAIPLVSQDRVIGVLDIGSEERDFFSEEDQSLLTFVAGPLASAIESSRLNENLRSQAQTLSLLHQASRELTSILDPEELLSSIATLVKRLIDYDLFSVMLWNERSQRLEHRFSLRENDGIAEKGGFALGYGIVGTVAALRQPIRVPNVHLDPRYVRCGREVQVNSELAVPLIFEGRLVGVLDLESQEYDAFRPRHEELLATLASFISIALENSRLYDQLRRDEARLAADVETAREVQKHLLPNSTPWVPGLQIAVAYAPARQLGGDLYDFQPYGEGRLALAVGDVSGKSTPAALFGSLVIGILRSHLSSHRFDPGEVLRLLNDQIHPMQIGNRFVALLFGIYDSGLHRLDLANSGLPRPLLVRNGQAVEIAVEGVPLGLLPDQSYEDRKIELEVSDAVVFYSDGIDESLDESEGEFGLGRIRDFLEADPDRSVREIADGLLEATDAYIPPGSEHLDDRMVIVLKRTE